MDKKKLPSIEAVEDVTTAVRRTLVRPGDELIAYSLLTMARRPDGKTRCQVLLIPEAKKPRLLAAMRELLSGPADYQEGGVGPDAT